MRCDFGSSHGTAIVSAAAKALEKQLTLFVRNRARLSRWDSS
jgi:hypothetical protein